MLSMVMWPIFALIAVATAGKLSQAPLMPGIMSTSQSRVKVPGDSPAYYNGDSSKDILTIDTLDLLPNPPEYQFAINLHGSLSRSIGSDPRLRASIRRSCDDETGSFEQRLCYHYPLQVEQGGKRAECPPQEGSVFITYNAIIPGSELPKGNYTARVEMWATDGARITDFEGTIFVDGWNGTRPDH